MATLYHNPRCSKSRQALALLTDTGKDFSQVLYLQTGLSISTISDLISRLHGEVSDLVRTGENEFEQSSFSSRELEQPQVVCELIHQHPILLQRPLFDDGESVYIGRPPENILVSSFFIPGQ
jgi:arsenate reductase